MSLRLLLSCIALSLCILFSNLAHARNARMVIWYPGEAGSTDEAAPVLGEFFKYIGAKIAPDTLNGKYFNTVADGLAYIQKEKPALGIISYAAWAQNKTIFADAAVFLAALPLPHGKARENYSLVGVDDKLDSSIELLTSEPMSESFIRDNLFSSIPKGMKILNTSQMLQRLKDIAEGKLAAKAILTSMEAATLQRLSAPWVKNLKTITQSKPVPTARVVLFDTKWGDAGKVRSALIAAGSDPDAKEIMEEMRLKGFAEDNN